MSTPAELRYSEEHEWVRLDGRTATIGITDHAQTQLGDIVFVELPSDGDTVDVGGEFGTVEAVKTVSSLFSPMAGTIIELNTELETRPEAVNEDPYGDGWMIKIEVADVAEFNALLTSDAYKDFVGE
ncbi:MAG TPA: glycine cleavage system protein GcvH [candidate division Zixibacteria bacterium]|jgi:glycine cleavage system H protein|nr:glycine cleavage system protein GcvH [candidate division Zixibacteria bacterium]